MLLVTLTAVWLVILRVFKKNELHFFYFLAGSVGLFSIMLYLGNGTAQDRLIDVLSGILAQAAPYVPFIEVFPQYGMINVRHGPECISFFVDYECSGFVEMLVFITLTWFYPIYSSLSRALLSIAGVAYIIAANIVRILMICFCIALYGVDSLFLAHAVLGRLVFFILVLLLYYNVFTKPHIRYQKVGEMQID